MSIQIIENVDLDEKFFSFGCCDVIDVLKKRLKAVSEQCSKGGAEFERKSFLAASGVYGITDDQEKAGHIRELFYNAWYDAYKDHCKRGPRFDYRQNMELIAKKNIVFLEKAETNYEAYCDEDGNVSYLYRNVSPRIILPTWEFVDKNQIKRIDLDVSDILFDWEVNEGWPEDDDLEPGDSYSSSYAGLPDYSFSEDWIRPYAFREYYPVDFHRLWCRQRDY